MNVSKYTGLGIGLLVLIVGIGGYLFYMAVLGYSFPPLQARIDGQGEFLILSSERASSSYAQAIDVARQMHPGAKEATYSPDDPAAFLEKLRGIAPRYVMIFIMPDELNANMAWDWLKTTAQVDSDPFVDVATGYVTGQTPEHVLTFVRRIKDAVDGKISLPGNMIDNLGANTQAQPTQFFKNPGSFFLPSYARRMRTSSISCGTRGFSKNRLDSMNNAGILHFGGHGYPDRIVDTLNGMYVRKLTLAPCVVFNGACYTGVTHDWFDFTSGKVQKKSVAPNVCFSFGMLQNNVIGYLAALHADQGIPVYQEMEYLAYSGASLGRVMKHTYDGLVLANNGSLPDFPGFTSGTALNWSPAQIMLYGTGTRVLFGDPSLIIASPFTEQPFSVESTNQGKSVRATFSLRNKQLRSTYTDTYHADLAYAPLAFNDRALLTLPLPATFDGQKLNVRVLSATADGATLRHRLVGQAVEHVDGKKLLHVQVDFPTTAYMKSAFRSGASQVVLELSQGQ